MSHTLLILIVVASVSLVAPSERQGAQTASVPADDGKREYTISGCLLRAGYAGYQVEEARLDAIDGKLVAESASPQTKTSVPKKWILDGGGNLGPRAGEKVQVVGRSDWQPPTSSSAAVDEPPNRTPHLDVKSVKTLAPSCS